MDETQRSTLFELADLILAVSRHINAVKETDAVSGTPMEGAVMRYIDRHPGTTAGSAAEATRLISSNFSRALRGLEQKGLLRREVDPDDGRRVLLFPTGAAHDNLQRLQDLWSRLLEATVDDPAEIASTIATLRRMEDRLTTADQRA